MKKLHTNTKKFKAAVKSYLLDCIREEEELNPAATDQEAFNYVIKRFKEEYNNPYEVKRYPNTQTRLAEWLKGLPLNIDYWHDDILKVYKDLHVQAGNIEPDHQFTKEQEGKFIKHWFNFLAMHILRNTTERV